ncbi:hypothetical protein FRC08_003168 [Ceratobasidium sp. 394]|nr:hypothetical protein FRC08_003168 [Ceratobasidium sp. 394]
MDDNPPLEYNVPLSDDTFASLRILSITGIESVPWIMGLWRIKPLVSPLEYIALYITPQDPVEPGFNKDWQDDLLLQICDSSPQVSDLVVHFSDTDGDGDEIPISASPRVLEALEALPLESLSLKNISFGSRVSCGVFSSAWLNITKIRCGQQSANLADLVGFARNLPHLEILVLDLDMGVSGIPDYSAPSFVPVPRYTAFRCLANEVPRPYKRSGNQTLKLAKYLYYLWPNVRCALSFHDLTEVESDYYGPGLEEGQRELNRLDTCIHKLRLKGLVSQ